MTDDVEPTFEIALAELERIVASLERGEPELTSALSKYEKGVQLLSICHRLLEKAEQSVAILTGVDEQNDAVTAPFDAAATVSAATVSIEVVEVKGSATDVSEPPKHKSPDKPTVRRGRIAPTDPTADPDDPPF
jgi:exodeoxyribonuclease VII small subunit